jgi:hypothetical protein
LGTNSITIKGHDGTSTTYTTSPTGTTYFVGSTAGVVGDLMVGENVSLELSTTTPQIVTKVTISPEFVFGSVTTIVGNVITVAGLHSTTWAVTVVPGTTTYTSGGAASDFAAVLVGSKIVAVGLPGTTADSLTASSVNIWAPRLQTHARGTVTVLGTNSITLKGHDGTSTTYTTSPTGTTYFEGSTAGVVGDLKVGENVSLVLSTTTPQIVTKVTICLERVLGSVTTIVGNVITVDGFHGTTYAVTVVPGTTTYTSGGAASTFAAILVGSKISAVGLPGTTTDSLTANSVNIWAPKSQGSDHGQDHGNNQGNNQGSNQGHGHGHGHGHNHH